MLNDCPSSFMGSRHLYTCLYVRQVQMVQIISYGLINVIKMGVDNNSATENEIQ